MEHTTAWIVVDDTDSRIEYHGDWIATTDEHIGPNGRAFKQTLHRASRNETWFTFSFNDSLLLLVYGSLGAPESLFLGEPIVTDLKTGCHWANGIGHSLGIRGSSSYTVEDLDSPPVHNQQFCGLGQHNSSASPGEHKFVFNIQELTNEVLYFDYLVYEPLPGAITDGDTLQIGNPDIASVTEEPPRLLQDSRFSFSPGWDWTSVEVAKTTTPGAFVTVKFNGTAIELYGELWPDFLANTATYQLDDHAPEAFELQSPLLNRTQSNQLFFNHSGIPPGEHTVIVTHNGSSTAMPLMIQYFFVTSLTLEEQASLPIPPSPSPSPSPSPANSRSRIRIIGGIIGGVVGLVLFLLLGIMWIRRGRRHRGKKDFTGLIPARFIGTSSKHHDADAISGPYNARRWGGPKASTNTEAGAVNLNSPPLPRPSNGSQEPNRELNDMRFGNLKLLQRVEVLQDLLAAGGSRGDVTPPHENDVRPSLGRNQQVEQEETDSGWRQQSDGVDRDMMQIPPPRYTET